MSGIELIVGLGNPGKKYECTRHNVGFQLLDAWTGSDGWQKIFKGEFKQINVSGRKLYVLKPQTFMNLSGQSVLEIFQFYKLGLAKKILVIHDELDLPFGTIALKSGGGLAGHNGLKSIAGLLGTQDFNRMRIGISRPELGSVADYVLSPYSIEEQERIGEILSMGVKKIQEVLEADIEDPKIFNSKVKIF